MDLIAEGVKRQLIRLEDDGKYIVYLHQNKRRNFSTPEEKVQTDTYLQLVLTYQYPADRILQYVPVQMGSETKEADIIVYADALHKAPLIVIECTQRQPARSPRARSGWRAGARGRTSGRGRSGRGRSAPGRRR